MIRVLIERQVAEDMEESYRTMLREMRREALHHAEGYISGETLRDAARPHHYFIISTWRSRHHWDVWAASAERSAAMERMAPLLAEPESIIVLEPI